jgi:septum formation topological specificity factor MinE
MSNLVTNEFTELIRKYVEIDDQLRQGREMMKKLNTEKKEIADVIQKYMKRKHIDELNLPDSKLSLSVTQSTQPLTKKVMEARIAEYGTKFLNDPNRAKHMIEFVTGADFRETVERTSLKRIFKRNK